MREFNFRRQRRPGHAHHPAPRGLAEPVRYIDVLNERTTLAEEDKAKVMGGNLARLIAA